MIDRRRFLGSAAAAGAVLAIGPGTARGQTLDSLKLFVPAAPGGGWDQTARSVEQAMKAAGIVSSIQLEHVPGAGGTVGLPRFVNNMKGQANTMMVSGLVMVGSIVANKTPVKLTQCVPVARLTGEYMVLAVPANSPMKNLQDFVAALKKDPGATATAGGSAGGTDHILLGLIAKAVGVDPKKINYVAFAGGGPAQASLLGGHVSAGISGYGEFGEQIKAGKLRALGITSDGRVPGIDTPTFKEQGVDLVVPNWRGLFAPPGINAQARDRLIAAVEKMAGSDAWKAELEKRGWTGILLTGDAFAKFIAEETQRIEGVLKDIGLA
ncbi:MAG: Bug family tripartite tricarboxylate transporter substrate binding protein [Alphaproteobacteria bacterium]